jgi:hypothetical protein
MFISIVKSLMKAGADMDDNYDSDDSDEGNTKGKSPLSLVQERGKQEPNWYDPLGHALLIEMVSSRIHRRIIVCCDGTWNDRQTSQEVTNETRILNCIASAHNVGHRRYEQLPYYIDGIGTGTKLLGSWWDGATGEGESICSIPRRFLERDH